MKPGNLIFLESSGPLQAFNGTALHYYYNFIMEGQISGKLWKVKLQENYGRSNCRKIARNALIKSSLNKRGSLSIT